MADRFHTFEGVRRWIAAHFPPDAIDTARGTMDRALLEWSFDQLNGNERRAQLLLIADALERCNCAAVYAPPGLYTAEDVRAKQQDWRESILHALADHEAATGKPFRWRGGKAALWAAVEWRAHHLATLIRDVTRESFTDGED